MVNKLVLDFLLNLEFFNIWRSPQLYKIVSDYEEVSSFMIARYLTDRGLCWGYPLHPSRYVLLSSIINGKVIEKELGLQIELQDKETADTSLFTPQDALLFYLLDLLSKSNFNIISLSGYGGRGGKYQLLTPTTREDHGNDFVITLDNCILNSEGKGEFHIEIERCRRLLLPSHISTAATNFEAKSQKEDDEFNIFDDINSPDIPAKKKDLGDQAMQVEILATGAEATLTRRYLFNRRDKNCLLAASNKQQLERGYCQYLPTTVKRFVQYWSSLSGLNIAEEGLELAEVIEGSYRRIVPVQVLVRYFPYLRSFCHCNSRDSIQLDMGLCLYIIRGIIFLPNKKDNDIAKDITEMIAAAFTAAKSHHPISTLPLITLCDSRLLLEHDTPKISFQTASQINKKPRK